MKFMSNKLISLNNLLMQDKKFDTLMNLLYYTECEFAYLKHKINLYVLIRYFYVLIKYKLFRTLCIYQKTQAISLIRFPR